MLQKDIGEIAAQTEFLARYAAIEAARGCESARPVAQLAEDLRDLSRRIADGDDAIHADETGEDKTGAEGIKVVESRLRNLNCQHGEISSLASKITGTARRLTRALYFEDVVSQVVVYSRRRADRLRMLVSGIEKQKNELDAALAMDNRKIGSRVDSIKSNLRARRDDSWCGVTSPASQNPLDRDDGEMV